MPSIVFAVLAILFGDSMPQANPDRDQATVSFEAKKITGWPKEALSLPEAIDLIAAQTGNRIVILGPERYPEVVQVRHQTNYEGKTFWEVAPDLAKTWDMRVNTNGDGCLLLNFGRDMREAAAAGTNYYEPWDHGALIVPVQFQGAYALTFGRYSDGLKVSLFPEPRLEHFQCDKAELTVVGKNGASVRLPYKPNPSTGLTFAFDDAKAPKEIAAVSFQCSLVYSHDWKIEKLGSLADVLKKPTKKHSIGLYDFRVVSSKYAVAVDKYTEAKKRTPGMVLGYVFASKVTYNPRDFTLVSVDQKSAIEGGAFDLDKYWAQEPSIEFHYPMDQQTPANEFELWVRAPHEVSKTTIKFSKKL